MTRAPIHVVLALTSAGIFLVGACGTSSSDGYGDQDGDVGQGQACASDADCGTYCYTPENDDPQCFCISGTCAAVLSDGASCTENEQCSSGYCSKGECQEPLPDGSPCTEAAGCASSSQYMIDACIGGSCGADRGTGVYCKEASQCASEMCLNNTCGLQPTGAACPDGPKDCASGICTSGKCVCIAAQNAPANDGDTSTCCSGNGYEECTYIGRIPKSCVYLCAASASCSAQNDACTVDSDCCSGSCYDGATCE